MPKLNYEKKLKAKALVDQASSLSWYSLITIMIF
jgi:hypothetical protein